MNAKETLRAIIDASPISLSKEFDMLYAVPFGAVLAILHCGLEQLEIEALHEYDFDNSPECARLEAPGEAEFYGLYARLGPDGDGDKLALHLVDFEDMVDAAEIASELAAALKVPLKLCQSTAFDTRGSFENLTTNGFKQ